MTKIFREIFLVILLIGIISCESNRFDGSLHIESPTQNEIEEVDILLKNLYQSFCYGNAEEPDWEMIRSVFFEGAQFVGEAPIGESPRPQTVEEFITNWQNLIRGSNSPTVETTEQIIETTATKIGRLIRVDVVFKASKSNDPSPRKPGLDSLVLANVNGVWKILSFIVHYESKLSRKQ